MTRSDRKAIRAEAAKIPIAAIKAQADRLTRESADLQALADAWRKAHAMEKRRREKASRSHASSNTQTSSYLR